MSGRFRLDFDLFLKRMVPKITDRAYIECLVISVNRPQHCNA